MKKLFVIILGVILMASCSNGLESQAKKQLKKTMKEILKNPDSATLTNVKTMVNNDSLCIIHFTCKAINGFGGYSTSRNEYIYIRIDNEDEAPYYKEDLFDLDDMESVFKSAVDIDNLFSDITKKDIRKNKSADEIERDSINRIYFAARSRLIFRGRKIEQNDGEEIKL